MTEAVELGLVATGFGDVRATHFAILQALCWQTWCRREEGLWTIVLVAHARMVFAAPLPICAHSHQAL